MRGGIRYMAGVEIGLKTHYMWITSGSVCSRADSGSEQQLPCPEEVRAPDVLWVGGRVPWRVEAAVLPFRLRADKLEVAHRAGNQHAVRLEQSCKQKWRGHLFFSRTSIHPIFPPDLGQGCTTDQAGGENSSRKLSEEMVKILFHPNFAPAGGNQICDFVRPIFRLNFFLFSPHTFYDRSPITQVSCTNFQIYLFSR